MRTHAPPCRKGKRTENIITKAALVYRVSQSRYISGWHMRVKRSCRRRCREHVRKIIFSPHGIQRRSVRHMEERQLDATARRALSCAPRRPTARRAWTWPAATPAPAAARGAACDGTAPHTASIATVRLINLVFSSCPHPAGGIDIVISVLVSGSAEAGVACGPIVPGSASAAHGRP
jgi:hypothetical protein